MPLKAVDQGGAAHPASSGSTCTAAAQQHFIFFVFVFSFF
jgi:hypothetical protein